jgi:hypothetical protein
MVTRPFHLVLAQMQLELVQQGRQLGNPMPALSPLPSVFVLFHPPPPFSTSLPIPEPSAQDFGIGVL